MEKDYDFLYEANNVYRTKNYIVKQIIGVRCSEQENNVMFSFDTYYRRTAKRNRIGAVVRKERLQFQKPPQTDHGAEHLFQRTVRSFRFREDRRFHLLGRGRIYRDSKRRYDCTTAKKQLTKKH